MDNDQAGSADQHIAWWTTVQMVFQPESHAMQAEVEDRVAVVEGALSTMTRWR